MKKLAVGGIALAAMISGSAMAADVPVKAPIYKTPPVHAYNWSGFYVGGHVGGGWSDGWTGALNPLPSPAAFGALGLNFSESGSGVIAGGQVGYNWQFAPTWVLGVEADLSSLRITANAVTPALTLAGAPFVGDADCPGTQVCTAFMNRKISSLGTVRGRLGYAWDHWLAYFTAGFAYARVNYSANYQVCCQHPASFTDTKTGGTVGGGLEYALPGAWGHWTVRGEYLFVRLDGASATIQQQSPPDTRFAVRYDWNRTAIQIARFGLNYKFD